MSIHLKRIVFFFCILCLGLGCCLGNPAGAQAPEPKKKLYLPGALNQYIRLAVRVISGRVWDLDKGKGLGGVEIYDKTKLVAITDLQGNYQFEATAFSYTLIPQLLCYQFDPPSPVIPGNEFNQVQNFTAAAHGCFTITGKVKWTNVGNCSPPTVAMEVYEQDGSLRSRAAADVDGNYSLLVPINWTGWVKPFSLGLKYSPEQINYYSLKENKTLQDYVAPGELPITGTLIWKTSSGAPLPIVVIKAYAQDGSYFRSATTGVDGKYTLPVPFGWTGSLKPDNLNYVFDPEKITYYCVGSGVSVADQNFRITKKP